MARGCREARPSHVLDVYENGQPVKQRKYQVVSRLGDNHKLGVFNNSVHSVERAMVERYFLCEVEPGVFEPALATNAREWQLRELVAFRDDVVRRVEPLATVLTLREVVKCYTGAKRKIYEGALRSLMRQDFNVGDACLRPFTKFEKQDLSKAPRIINPRSPRYNLKLGKYLKKSEKLFYAAVNQTWRSHTAHTVIKGMNSLVAGNVLKAKWDRFRTPVAIGLDAKKYDMHVSTHALRYEHGFYNGVFNSAELESLLRLQLNNGGVAYCPDGEVHFTVPGTRCSGDLNTSLGNCLIMCGLLHALCATLDIEAELANNGDDCVLFMDDSDRDRFERTVVGFFRTYGFRMTVEAPVHTFERVEFCQSQPVALSAGWTMVRNVRTCLKKDPMCLIPIQNDKVWRKWLGAVGECGLATVPGCPVLQSFYGAFLRSGKSSSRRFREHIFRNTSMLERGYSAEETPVTDEARASFYAAFGITPDYQLALEHYYDRFTIGSWDGTVVHGQVETAPPVFLRHL